VNFTKSCKIFLQFIFLTLIAYGIGIATQAVSRGCASCEWLSGGLLALALCEAALVLALIYLLSAPAAQAQVPKLADADKAKLLVTFLDARMAFAARCYRSLQFWSLGLMLLAGLVLFAAFRFIFLVAKYSNDPELATYLAAGTGVGALALCVLLVFLAHYSLNRGGRMFNKLCSRESGDVMKILFEPKSPVAGPKIVRINAGGPAFTDGLGRKWAEDTGFASGKTEDFGVIQIDSLELAQLYRTDRASMTAFRQALPNGSYVVNLHFAETDANVNAATAHIFQYRIQGGNPIDMNIFQEAGNRARTPVVKPYNIMVANGSLQIDFLPRPIPNPPPPAPAPPIPPPIVSGIEIIPTS
jgi:hypothetical protein